MKKEKWRKEERKDKIVEKNGRMGKSIIRGNGRRKSKAERGEKDTGREKVREKECL